MKKILFGILLCLAFGASAFEIPQGPWTLHEYPGFQPFANLQVTKSVDGDVISVTEVKGKDGAGVKSTTRFPVREGDVLTIRYEVKGTGKLSCGLYLWGVNKEGRTGCWGGNLTPGKFALADDWTPHSQTVTVRNRTNVQAREAALDFECSANGEFQVRRISVTRRIVKTQDILKDDFETDKKRIGNPQLKTREVSSGLLVNTRVGVYTTQKTTEIDAGVCEAAPEGAFRQLSFRLYALGGEGARLEGRLSSGRDSWGVAVVREKHMGLVRFTLTGQDMLILPYEKLPADVALSFAADGHWELAVTSLADSSAQMISGEDKFFKAKSYARSLALIAPSEGEASAVMLDNLELSDAAFERVETQPISYHAPVIDDFDPVKAGWPLVFEDEFNGPKLDDSKWVISQENKRQYVHFENGILRIEANRDPKNTNVLATASLYSRESFVYGYFESRVKFTHQPGWWAAFWLCARMNQLQPFVDGFEIDIFEDYTTRVKSPDLPPVQKIDHNLHSRGSSILKSWNYNSQWDGPFDGWHTIACKWTPFEITYYFDGKAMKSTGPVAHSPYNTVTFDAFRHAAGIAPLSVIVSGISMATKSFGVKDLTGYTYPEYFNVDYVRVYAYPAEGSPVVTLQEKNKPGFTILKDQTLEFSVAAEGASKIKAVHLFADGYYLATKTEPPYDFTACMNESYLRKTAWMKPGRQGDVPSSLDGMLHVFCAFAEDSEGRVGSSGTITHITRPRGTPTPYGGVPQMIPGTVEVTHFDEGGNGVAYYDLTPGNASAKAGFRVKEDVDCNQTQIGSTTIGEWLGYTVDVEAEGTYRMSFQYGTPVLYNHKLLVSVDGRLVGAMKLPYDTKGGWSLHLPAHCTFKLSAGRHILRLHFFGSINLGPLTVEKIKD